MARQGTKTFTNEPAAEETTQTRVGQHKPTEEQFRLQVDRQTKGSYATYEAAERDALAIKKAHPIVRVAVYDAVEGINKIIESPLS